MQTPMIDYLHLLLESVGEDAGEVASYIPELANADPDRLAVAVATLDGEVYVAGDADGAFTNQ